jgi:uncharacterized protein (DUF2336 family)
VTDILVGRGDRAVAISVAGNAGARLSENGFMVLIRRSAEDDVLAERLGERREIPAHLFLKLLSVASEKVRAKLRASHPHAGAEIDRVVAEVTDRMRSPIVAAQRDYSAILQELGSRFIARKLGEADLVRFLLAERFDEVVVTLALMARIHVSVVDRAMHGDRSDVVIIIARAIGLKWPTTKLILQLWAQPRPLTAAEVGQNLASFEQLTQATAAQLIRFHDAASPRSKQPD